MTTKIREEQLLLAEMQVLLAELRTHLSLVRTGAGIAVSSSSIGFLVFANGANLPQLMMGYSTYLYFILIVVVAGGLYMFIRSERKIMAISKLIKAAEKRNKMIDKIMV